jgi:hypothetical protein
MMVKNTLAYFAPMLIADVKSHSSAPWANVIKLLTAVSYQFSLQARAFVPFKPFQSSQMLVGKARSLPWSGAPDGAKLR